MEVIGGVGLESELHNDILVTGIRSTVAIGSLFNLRFLEFLLRSLFFLPDLSDIPILDNFVKFALRNHLQNHIKKS